MTEMSTREISKENIESLLAAASKVKGFKAIKNQFNVLSLKSSKLNPIDAYELQPNGWQEVSCKSRSFKSSHLPLFKEINNRVKYKYKTFCTLAIAHSGEKFDIDEETDIELDCGFDYGQAFIGVDIGAVSPICNDLPLRSQFLNDFLNVIGLGDQLQTYVDPAKKVTFRVCGEKFIRENSIPKAERLMKRQQGFYLFRSMMGDDINIRDMTLNCLSNEEFLDKVGKATAWLGGAEKILEISFSFVFTTKDEYEELRSILNGTELSPFEVMLSAKPRFTLSEIGKASQEFDSFLIDAFHMKPPKIGEVVCQIAYNNGKYTLTFACEFKNNRQEQVLEKLIIELAGGEDIIDRTPL